MALKDMFTEPDNSTPCVSKIMGALSFLYFHGAQGWDVFVNHLPLNATGYAAGIGALFASLGVLLGTKKDSPVQPEEK